MIVGSDKSDSGGEGRGGACSEKSTEGEIGSLLESSQANPRLYLGVEKSGGVGLLFAGRGLGVRAWFIWLLIRSISSPSGPSTFELRVAVGLILSAMQPAANRASTMSTAILTRALTFVFIPIKANVACGFGLELRSSRFVNNALVICKVREH